MNPALVRLPDVSTCTIAIALHSFLEGSSLGGEKSAIGGQERHILRDESEQGPVKD